MTLRPAAVLLLVATCALAAAAQEAPPPVPTVAAAPPERPEPKVVNEKIEDDNIRIEELRVRGESRRLVVSQKKGTLPQYEFVPDGGSRDPSQRTRGAAGQRVWNVLSF